MRNRSDSNSDSDERSDFRLSKDYSKYVIVAESEFEAPGDTGKSAEIAFHNALWKIFRQDLKGPISPSYSTFSYDDSPRSSSQSPSRPASRPPRSPYKPKLDTRIRKKFNSGATTARYFEALHCSSVVIRILEEKKQFQDQLAEQWTPDVTFVVNGEKCEANRQYLANASPVFRKMLFGKFAEAKQSEIVLEGIESADVFQDFILAVSHFGVQPNPTNVLDLLKLAHLYDVPNLMRKCEEHLKFCYEIPIDDRIFLAAEYDLNGLKVHTALEISDLRWKEMWKEHKEKLLNPEFICLFDIIMGQRK